MKDRTSEYDYAKLIKEEKEHYSKIEITEHLKEGGAHANDSWHYYWQGVAQEISKSAFSNMADYLDRNFGGRHRPIRILSLGSGYCGNEVDWARSLRSSYLITCTDINDQLFLRAAEVAEREGLSMEFLAEDLNFIQIEPGRFDLIFAHAILHHVINLEHLLDQIVHGLSKDGLLHLVEVVGMNRKLIWDENERFANALLEFVPKQITRGLHLTVDFAADGMEGVRQEDVLPLLRERFRPVFEWQHGAFMRYICTHPELGRYFDPNSEVARPFLDFLIDGDSSAVRHRVLRPLEIWGVYSPLRSPSDVAPER